MLETRTPDPAAHRRSPHPPAPRLDRSRQAAPQVLDCLRARIVALELAPGVVLSRADLAAEFGVSQTPVRDALMLLEEEGLVLVFAQHKTVVARVDIAHARHAHFLRRALELEIVRTLATTGDAKLVVRLRATIAQQRAALAAGDLPAFTGHDQSFHEQMFAAADVPDLWADVRRRSGHLDRLRRLHLPAKGKGDAILRDHTRIVGAIARRDPDAAQQRVREHLAGTLLQADAIRERYPDYVTN